MKRLNLYYIFILLIFISSNSFSYISEFQPPYSDYHSISEKDANNALTILKANPPNNLKEKLQHYLIVSNIYNDLAYPDDSLNAAQEGLKLIDKNAEPWLFHSLKIAESYAYELTGDAKIGMDGAIKALNWATINNHLDLQISAHMALGFLLTITADYIAALDNLQKAYDESNETTIIKKGVVSNLIALVYNERKEYDLAIPFYKEALNFDRNYKKDSVSLSVSLYGLGRAYVNTNEIQKGKDLMLESLHLSEKIDDIQGVAYAKHELAIIAKIEKKYSQGIALLNEALIIFKSSKNKFMLFNVYKNLVQLYLITDQLKFAKQHLTQAKIYVDSENQPIQSVEYERLLADVLSSEGNHTLAYKTLKYSIVQENKLITANSTQKLHQLRAQFDLESKEKENQILSARNELQDIKIKTQSQNYQALQQIIVFVLIILVLFAVLIYRTRKHKLHFQYMANHDGLTGLYNRNYILEKLDTVMKESTNHRFQYNIVMIDLDYFKKLNDNYGHAVGDQVLVEIAKLFLANIENNEFCGRLGGEEFLLILPRIDVDRALKKVNDIKLETLKIGERLNLNKQVTSLSAGIVNIPSSSIEYQAEEIMKCADEALYKAKSLGRNTIVVA